MRLMSIVRTYGILGPSAGSHITIGDAVKMRTNPEVSITLADILTCPLR